MINFVLSYIIFFMNKIEAKQKEEEAKTPEGKRRAAIKAYDEAQSNKRMNESALKAYKERIAVAIEVGWKTDRTALFLLTEPLLVYSDENRMIALFVFILFLMDYIDRKHCHGKIEIVMVRSFSIMASTFIRIAFLFYTIYYGLGGALGLTGTSGFNMASCCGNIRNVLYAIYLIIISDLDWDECERTARSKRTYNIIDYSSRVIFLIPCLISIPAISINLDLLLIPFALIISGIVQVDHFC
jgi:hypothetical protein